MADNFVEGLRRQAASSSAPRPPAATATQAPDEYVAFAARDKSQFLDIRLARPPHHSPRTHLLVNVAHDGALGTNFLATYTTMSVMVCGRNLQEVVFAIQNNMATQITEYDPDKWPKPQNEKAPFIESIAIHLHSDLLGSKEDDTKH